MAMGGPDLDRLCSQHSYDEALLNLYESNLIAGRMGSPPVRFIDLPLATGSVDKMVVTLGSHISDDDREAVLKVINLHAPRIEIVESRMNIRRIRLICPNSISTRIRNSSGQVRDIRKEQSMLVRPSLVESAHRAGTISS